MCSNQFATTTTSTSEVKLLMTNESDIAVDKQPKRRMSTVSLESMHEEEEEEEKRAVHFAEYVSFVTSPSPLDRLLEDDITSYSELWYQLSDLALFRDEARSICREMRRQDELEPTYNPRLLHLSSSGLSRCSSDDESNNSNTTNTSTRGLEQRSCLERQRRKYLAGRFILKAARQGTCPQRLALVSQRLTSWASELAREEAQRDHVQAYPAAPQQHQHDHNHNHKRSKADTTTTATAFEPVRCVRARV